MTASQPPAERLTYCQETVDAAAEKATSQEDLMHAIAPMQAAVDRDPEAFHWCFFNLMAHLDTRMENGGSLSEELQPAFFEGMRKLWILSRALDNNLGVRTYFGFLRHRYLHMSHDYFGRSLEIVTRPMDNFPLKPKSKSDSDDSDDDGSKPVKSTVGEKPAGAADVD